MESKSDCNNANLVDCAGQRSDDCDDRMQLETKFLRLHTAVTLGSRFGDWQVCWLGGWNKHRFGFIVMVVRVNP